MGSKHSFKLKMKLNLLLISAVVAKNKIKEKGKGNEVRYWSNPDFSIPETCESTFSKNNAGYGSVLDIGNSGTSGFIDIHDYPNDANCFIEVVADVACLEVTAKVIHAGLESSIYDGCEESYYNDYYEDYDACCPFDNFWFDDEEERGCGCKGDNLEFGDGCNDNLFSFSNTHQNYHPDHFWHMKDSEGIGFDDRTFNSNSFKFNFATDGSVARGNVRIEWCCSSNGVCDSTPSAPADPKDRLDQIVQFSVEVLDNFFADHKRINNWKKKFARNAYRMEKSFFRCGEDPVVEAENEWASYDDSNGENAMNDVTTGFSKWATTYISGCGGQKRENHHVKRMKKWNQKFQNL